MIFAQTGIHPGSSPGQAFQDHALIASHRHLLAGSVMSVPPLPRLYTGLAAWWPLFSRPQDYGEEASWIFGAFRDALGRRPDHIFELGSGGGNVASHLSRQVRMTLSDISKDMLELSRRLNPDSEHVAADMRNVRIGKTFDAVLIHDAIMYLTTAPDLVASLVTARVHLKAGGALIVLPDYVAETFEPRVQSGGHDAADGSARALRYLAWARAPKAGATEHVLDFAFMLRVADGTVEVFHDRHRLGIFPRAAWREAFLNAGFAAPSVRTDPWRREVFVARPQPTEALSMKASPEPS
jgi:SAM-dependent methyltransferase